MRSYVTGSVVHCDVVALGFEPRQANSRVHGIIVCLVPIPSFRVQAPSKPVLWLICHTSGEGSPRLSIPTSVLLVPLSPSPPLLPQARLQPDFAILPLGWLRPGSKTQRPPW